MGPICNFLAQFVGNPAFGGSLGSLSAINTAYSRLADLEDNIFQNPQGRWVSTCIPQAPDSEWLLDSFAWVVPTFFKLSIPQSELPSHLFILRIPSWGLASMLLGYPRLTFWVLEHRRPLFSPSPAVPLWLAAPCLSPRSQLGYHLCPSLC